MYSSSAEGSAFGMVWMVLMVATYIYACYCQMRMAQKLGHGDTAWWSWVPIMQLFLFVKMASKPWWWAVLCLIPIVNLVVFIVMSVQIAKDLGQSPFWGVMMFFPVINFAALGVLAFGGSSSGSYQRVPAGFENQGSAPSSPAPSQPAHPSHSREPQG